MSANQSIFGRYMATRDKKPSAFAKTGTVSTTINPHIDNLAQSFTIGDTKVFGTHGVNNVRFAFFDPHDLGINVNSHVPHQMIVVVTGGFSDRCVRLARFGYPQRALGAMDVNPERPRQRVQQGHGQPAHRAGAERRKRCKNIE